MRTHTILTADWRIFRDGNLPEVAPDSEHECVITPRKFVVLHRILTCDDMILVCLQVGAIEVPFELVTCSRSLVRLLIGTIEVPFEMALTGGPQRMYKPQKLCLPETGAVIATVDSIAVAPALEIRARLRNEGNAPTKPRAALLVYEEI